MITWEAGAAWAQISRLRRATWRLVYLFGGGFPTQSYARCRTAGDGYDSGMAKGCFLVVRQWDSAHICISCYSLSAWLPKSAVASPPRARPVPVAPPGTVAAPQRSAPATRHNAVPRQHILMDSELVIRKLLEPKSSSAFDHPQAQAERLGASRGAKDISEELK